MSDPSLTGGGSFQNPNDPALSEYREGGSQINKTESTKVLTLPSSQTMNYARAAESAVFPKREQGIILHSVQGVPIKEYVNQLSKIVPPENIKFISRVSGNRICAYLSSKELVDNLISQNQHVKIGNEEIQINPLSLRSKRIILSNVCPEIPHEDIENKLKSHNLRLESKVSFIRASDTGHSYIMSFRRQVYLHPEDTKLLPGSFVITHDNLSVRIFVSDSSLSCFMC